MPGTYEGGRGLGGSAQLLSRALVNQLQAYAAPSLSLFAVPAVFPAGHCSLYSHKYTFCWGHKSKRVICEGHAWELQEMNMNIWLEYRKKETTWET
jgi:hypothetical protein